MKKAEYIVVDFREMEKKIQDHFGRPDYNIVADNEWDNDSDHALELDGEVTFHEYIEKFKAGQRHGMYMIYDLLNQMVKDGVLEPGNYLIEVCW